MKNTSRQLEIWEDIPNYQNFYQANPCGLIKSLPKSLRVKNGFRVTKELIIANTNNGNGYLVCSLSKNTKRKSILLHRIIAMTFIPNPNNLPEVNHKDGNKNNNHVDNLEWCARQENIDHSWDKKLTNCIGEKHHNSKLNNQKVKEIRDKYSLGNYSYSKLAKEYETGLFNIRNIVKRHTWNHSGL